MVDKEIPSDFVVDFTAWLSSNTTNTMCWYCDELGSHNQLRLNSYSQRVDHVLGLEDPISCPSTASRCLNPVNSTFFKAPIHSTPPAANQDRYWFSSLPDCCDVCWTEPLNSLPACSHVLGMLVVYDCISMKRLISCVM